MPQDKAQCQLLLWSENTKHQTRPDDNTRCGVGSWGLIYGSLQVVMKSIAAVRHGHRSSSASGPASPNS